MSPHSIAELIGIAVFVLFAAIAAWLWDQPWRRGLRHPVQDRFADRAEAMLSDVFADAQAGGSPERDDGDNLIFRAQAERDLAPRLESLVTRLSAHGVQATFRREQTDDAQQPIYLLEIKPPNRAAAFPASLSFRPGHERDLLIVYGGDISGPSDHNGHDAQVGWREIDWRDVEPVLLRFTARVVRAG
ncbi:hypothetical protein ACO2Q0_20800 [Phenylobacterium sp. VNQ135]|uniref:hypothetical protein n=1 Tax=Phenylobacterium sp. VNQ135 TaxID=3400922 RepID=UPI003C115BE2